MLSRNFGRLSRSGLILLTVACCYRLSSAAPSFYPQLPEDPGAVVLSSATFGAIGDGLADDTAALQAAIDQVESATRYGVVLIPSGTYRLTATLHVWKGIRLIGYGPTRPVFKLGTNTPGFQTGDTAYLVNFVSNKPAPGDPIRPANPGTFYSAMSNIDIEIADGNPAAIGVRFHVAQHGFLAHMEFRIGQGRAGIEKVGNEMEDLRFLGGDYGILTTKPSPSWPFVLMDASFEGQRIAAVQTEEAGMTIIRGHFKNVPTAILVPPNRAEELFIRDSRFENISGPAIVISDEANARSQFNLVDVVAINTPVLAAFRSSGKQVLAPAPNYRVASFTHGNQVADLGATPTIQTTADLQPLTTVPPLVPTEIPALPPRDTWVSVRDFGAVGDGLTDDSPAIEAAIAAHATLFFPTGRYRLTRPLKLRPDSHLVGLSPFAAQLILTDHTPAFAGAGTPVPLLETPPGGTNIVTGLGIDTGINGRALGIKWRASAHSLLNDVRLLGGHGTYRADGSPVPVYNTNRTADADPARPWDSQSHSIWVTDGGGGIFKGIWTPNPYAQSGFYVSDTTTPGKVYAVSSEHHVRHEIIVRRAANWEFYALQMEEEYGEGPDALPVLIEDSHDLLFANLYLYRVVRSYSPAHYAVRVKNSSALHFRGVHLYGPSKFNFDATVYVVDHDTAIVTRELARLDLSGAAPVVSPEPADIASPVRAAGVRPIRLVGGFNNIEGAVVDPTGRLYFVDEHFHRIYRWSPATADLTVVRDAPIEPVTLALDDSGHLLVVTRFGRVFSFDPDATDESFLELQPVPAAPRPGMKVILPVTRWRDAHTFLADNERVYPLHYLTPDGSSYLPAGPDLAAVGASFRWATVDVVRAFQLRSARPGDPFVVADEFGQKTYRFTVQTDGSLADPVLVAEEGEAGVAIDAAGNTYVAAGDLFVYDPAGKLIDRIALPERPSSLVFGGADRQTLFICARHSLYALPVKIPGL